MSSFLNRLKNLKPGSINFNNNESDTGSLHSFDEEGFLCPICHRKFRDTSCLERHYLQAHSELESSATYTETNGNRKYDEFEDPTQEVSIWKQQFFSSEESRMQLSSELMQQKQRAGDLEEELQSVQKQLHSTQIKVVEQSQQIGNLKAANDVYDVQLAMFTDELLSTQGELKEKQNQVDTLCNDLIPSLPTNDDVDVLKRELITVQQCMNDMSLGKEQQLDVLRRIFFEISQDVKQFDEIETRWNQNIVLSEQFLSNHASEILTNLDFIQQQKLRIKQIFEIMRTDLARKQTQIEELKQVNIDLEQRLKTDFEKQLEDYRIDYEQLEKQFEQVKQDKYQLLMNQYDQDQDNQRQNLVQQLTQEKEHFEQQIKHLKKQIKQFNEDKLNEINTLNETIQAKERQLNEMSSNHEQYRIDCQQSEANLRENHKEEIQRLENEFNEMKCQLNERNNELENNHNQLKQTIHQHEQTSVDLQIVQNEKNALDNQYQTSQQTIESFQTNISQLNSQLDKKNQLIDCLSSRIRQSIEFVHKIHRFIQEKILTSQTNLFSILEQSEQDLQTIRTQTHENIRQELTNYLTVILENKIQFDKQTENDRFKFAQQQEHSQNEYQQLKSNYIQCQNDKSQLEIQFNEINQNRNQLSETLSQTNQQAEQQRENFEKQINSLENELTSTRSDIESLTKKSEMQLAALRENLSTVRSEFKLAQEKLIDFEQMKNDKIDLQKRFDNLQDEQKTLIEHSLTNENRNEKLQLENGQLAKKIADLEYALQELAREYQGLQIQTNRINERRWMNDHDIHQCMKCTQTFTLTQRKHHCRNCGNVFCDNCSSKTAVIAATSKKPQRVCDQCYRELAC